MSDKPESRRAVARPAPEGLLPPVAELEAYERLVPGIAERLVGRWEQESEHRRAMERLQLESQIASERLGLVYGFRISLAFLVVSALIIALGLLTREWIGTVTGGVLGGVDLVALAYVFIVGRNAPPPRGRK